MGSNLVTLRCQCHMILANHNITSVQNEKNYNFLFSHKDFLSFYTLVTLWLINIMSHYHQSVDMFKGILDVTLPNKEPSFLQYRIGGERLFQLTFCTYVLDKISYPFQFNGGITLSMLVMLLQLLLLLFDEREMIFIQLFYDNFFSYIYVMFLSFFFIFYLYCF